MNKAKLLELAEIEEARVRYLAVLRRGGGVFVSPWRPFTGLLPCRALAAKEPRKELT